MRQAGGFRAYLLERPCHLALIGTGDACLYDLLERAAGLADAQALGALVVASEWLASRVIMLLCRTYWLKKMNGASGAASA